MNTLEINKVLATNTVTSQAYIGCFPADQIPTSAHRYPHCMVVNMDPSGFRGSHWVSLYSPSPNQMEYYDPLGIWPPPSPYLTKHLSGYAHLKYNTLPLQSSHSRACGRHAIFFLYSRCSDVPFEKIVNLLQSAKTSPDIIVNQFIRNVLFHKHV